MGALRSVQRAGRQDVFVVEAPTPVLASGSPCSKKWSHYQHFESQPSAFVATTFFSDTKTRSSFEIRSVPSIMKLKELAECDLKFTSQKETSRTTPISPHRSFLCGCYSAQKASLDNSNSPTIGVGRFFSKGWIGPKRADDTSRYSEIVNTAPRAHDSTEKLSRVYRSRDVKWLSDFLTRLDGENF